MSRNTLAYIQLEALAHNFHYLKSLAPRSRMMLPIKCDAYGHGAKRIVTTLTDADAFAVAYLEEALALNELTTKPIVILDGLFSAAELSQLAPNHQMVVHHREQLEMLERYQGTQLFSVWLKINTGMNRLGIHPKEFPNVWQRLQQCRCVKQPLNIMTHLANADDLPHPLNSIQLARFDQTIPQIHHHTSIANSAALWTLKDSHREWIRPGLALYGISPFSDRTGSDLGLRPVMTFTTNLMAIHQLYKGDQVGYSSTYTCPEDMAIGILAVGYGDGYPFLLPHQESEVWIQGCKVPIIGRVSMDMTAVDLRRCPHAKLYDPVILWGNELPLEILAQNSQRLCYELLTHVHQRVKRCSVTGDIHTA